MAGRNLSLTPRAEEVREVQPIAPPVHFSLAEIKQHFDESLDGVKGQYVTKEYVEDYIEKIEKLVGAIQAIAVEKG